MKKEIRAIIKEYSNYDFPDNLAETIEMLSEHLRDTEHKNIEIEICTHQEWEDTYIRIYITGLRLENDEEYQKRLIDEKQDALRAEAHKEYIRQQAIQFGLLKE